MDKFQSNFVNEATELLADLETALLTLEGSPNDLSMVGEVFRVMHTLKGSAAMFGFDKIGELTHHLETIYDQVRDSQRKLTRDIFDQTLTSLDYIQILLNDPELSSERDQKKYDELLRTIITIAGNEDGEATVVQVAEEKEATFYVRIKPLAEIFQSGSNPLFLLEDIGQLGDMEVIARVDDIPELDDIVPETCYTWWELVVSTNQGKEAIEDVFIFVEDECDVEIELIAEKNLLKDQSFKDVLAIEFKAPSVDKTKLKIVSGANEKEVKKSSYNKKSNTSASSIRVATDKVDDLMNLVSQLITMQASLNLYAHKKLDPELFEINEQLEKLSRQLRDNAFGMSLIPVDTMLVRFRRLVRDVANELDKDVEFEVVGSDTELDKNIIEKLIDPIMHIIRNSLDHGLETKEERIQTDKPQTGVITFKAYYSGASVNIELSDDGKGINHEVIRKKAIEKGIIDENSTLTKKEIYDLLFHAGFSTAAKVTDVSGRGVGMDVVKRNIEDLRGEIVVDSVLGKGTTITLRLPLTLSIIDGLLIRIDKTFYVLPIGVIEKCHEIEHTEILKNFNKLLVIEGEQVPYFYLREEFNILNDQPETHQLIVVKNDEKRVGLTFDEVVGELQAVVKPLGKYYKHQDIFSGSTILGDGTVALVLDSNRIINNLSQTVNSY